MRERATADWLRDKFSPEQVEAMVRSAKAAIVRESPDLRLPEPALAEFAYRRVLDQYAEQAGVLGFDEFASRPQMCLPI
jgi:hypothetical protein